MRLHKFIITLLTLFLAGLPACAQVGEQRSNLAVGFNAGMNLNSVSFSPTVPQGTLQGINGGLTARYISEKYFSMICGAQIELNYSQHGWSESPVDYPDLSYKATMNYIEIPFLAHLAFGKERGMQFFIHAGPQIGFLIGEKRVQGGDWSAAENLIIEQHKLDAENKFDYGITGGAGLELRTKAGNFLLEGRYYYALSDFYNSTKKDYFSRSAHNAITIKFSYLFDLSNKLR